MIYRRIFFEELTYLTTICSVTKNGKLAFVFHAFPSKPQMMIPIRFQDVSRKSAQNRETNHLISQIVRMQSTVPAMRRCSSMPSTSSVDPCGRSPTAVSLVAVKLQNGWKFSPNQLKCKLQTSMLCVLTIRPSIVPQKKQSAFEQSAVVVVKCHLDFEWL